MPIDLPGDCAFAVGVPLTRHEFDADLGGNIGDRDFIRQFQLSLCAFEDDEIWLGGTLP